MHGSYARITLAATGESLGLSSKTGVKSRIITSLYCDRTNQGRIRNESGVLQHYLLTCLYGNTCRTNQERANRVTPHQWKMRVTPHQWKMRVIPHQWKMRVIPHQWKMRVTPHQWKMRVIPHQWKMRVILT